MALRNLPTRQDPRPGTNDGRFATSYDPAAGGWTAAALPSDEEGDGTCNLCGSLVCRCGQAR